jgi:hypothetical protein
MDNNADKPAGFRIIRPELVAKKFAAIRNYECPSITDKIAVHPRFLELLLAIQAASMAPGAVSKYTADVLAEFPEQLGTATMRSATGTAYTLKEKMAIWHEMPDYVRPSLPQGASAAAAICGHSTPAELAALEAKERRELESALAEFTPARFRAICERHAMKHLPEYLVRLCTETEHESCQRQSEELASFFDRFDDQEPEMDRGWCGRISETWYFENLIGTLIEFMDRQAQKVQSALAMTAVIEKVFETVDEVLETHDPRMLRGNHRFGKTEGLRAKCAMHPGRLRLVRTPRGNSLRELLVRIAEALGIDTSYGCALGPLQAKIEYVIDETRIGLVFDEGAWLIPEGYSKKTQPARLNWIRSVLLDPERPVPVIIAVTPQWYDDPLKLYLKETRYAMEQFTGRMPRVELATALEEADLLRVAAFHFPEFKRKTDLMEIAAVALTAEAFLKAFEQISKHARYLAKRDGVPFTMDLVRIAIRDLFPNKSDAKLESAPRVSGVPEGSRNRAKQPAKPLVNARLNGLSRGIQPARMGRGTGEDLDSSSMSDAGPERVERNLVPVET